MADQLEGKNPILEALKANLPIDKIMVLKDIGRHSSIAEIFHLAKQNHVPIVNVDKAGLDRISQTGKHQGIIAYAAEKQYVEVEDLLDIIKKSGQNAFLMMLDNIEDPHNLGAIIRSAEGAGVHGIIIPNRRSAGLTSTVARTSAGAIAHMPVARAVNLSDAIAKLKKENIWVIGIESSGKTDYTKFDLKMPVALVVGGEGKGISRLVKENCDEVVSIPMKGKISSLNASVAAALVMYEVLKQRSS